MNTGPTRCLIIDDEPLAIRLIKNHLGKLSSFEVVGECRNALEAVEILMTEKIDLMFLDINMPEITGLEFLRSLPNPPPVIITTAFREYAVEGYEFDVIDFLLKPISFERFLKAINRYIDRTRSAQVNNEVNIHPTGEKSHIFIQDGKNTIKLELDDILYFEGYGEYVKVITGKKNYVVRGSMTEFENKLLNKRFVRIHKSYIVNIQKINGYSSIQVILQDKTLPVGRIYRERLKSLLNNQG